MEREVGSERGTAEWAAAKDTPRGRLEAELIEELRGSQSATHQMDEAAARAMGINATDGQCLDIVDRRGRITAGGLAHEAGLTTGAITAVLDRLEERGFLRRVPDPGDRRRVLVEATDKQRREAMRLYGPLKEMSADWLDRRGDEELRLLIEFCRISREVNERRAAEIRVELAPGSAG
jgi:DNA-binding MarR family transcriptional regulator